MALTAPRKVLRTLFPGARSGELPAPRAQQAPEETGRDRVAAPQGLALAIPHPPAQSAPAEELTGVCAWGSGSATLPPISPLRAGGRQRERVRRWFRTKAGWYAVLADPQMPATSTLLDQVHNAIERKLFAMQRISPSRRQSTGVSRRSSRTCRYLVQYSASRQACRTVRGGSSRGRQSPNTRLVPQSPNSHVWRVSLSGNTLH